MDIFVAEMNGNAVAAFNAATPDEAEAFAEAEPFTKDAEASTRIRLATPEESKRWEASRSRPDHSNMSNNPHRWVTML